MAFGGSKIQSQGPNPNLVWSQMQNYMQPVTQLPSNMQQSAPSVLSPGQLVSGGRGQEKQLAKMGLDVTNQNPLFSPNALQNYANQDYQIAMQPLLNNATQAQYMNDPTNSTFSAAMLGNEAAGLGQQAFENAANYQNQNYNQLMGRRGAFYGQDVALGQQQNNSDIERALNLNSQNLQGLGMLNTSQSNTLNALSGVLNNSTDANLQGQMDNAQLSAARTASLGNLIGGGVGTLFGLGNGFLGSGSSGGFGGSGSSLGSFFSTPTAPTFSGNLTSGLGYNSGGSTFPTSSFQNLDNTQGISY